MKPRSKLHVKILGISQTLPKITDGQEAYGFKNCYKHIGYRSKKNGTGCLDCGYVWQLSARVKSCKCPSCGVKLAIEDTRKKNLSQGKRYFSVLDVRDEYQVVRIFELYYYQKVGERPRTFLWEVVQQFFSSENEMIVVARNRSTCFNNNSFNGDLEIRSTKGWYGNKYDVWTEITYPKIKVLPEFKRNGYNNKVEGVSHFLVMRAIMRDTKAETLIKAKQIGLLAARVGNKNYEITKYWSSIKICIRNNYIVPDEQIITYLDYLDLLTYYKKDLHNPKYICPNDIKKEHDKLSAKKQAAMKHERNWRDYVYLVDYFGDQPNHSLKSKPVPLQLEVNRLSAHKAERERQLSEEKRAKKIHQDQIEYAKLRGGFFGIAFTDGKITVAVLQSIDEFLKEGEALKHCVFSNEYFKKETSLIMSARVDDQPVETVEIALDKMEIVQSRGLGNKATPYHDEIVKLVRKNLPVIKEKYKSIAA